jgi:hypothetical protein
MIQLTSERMFSPVLLLQLTVNHWLLHHGMSIGIGDTVADEVTMTRVNDIIEKAKQDVKAIIVTYQSGDLEQQPGRTIQVRLLLLCGWDSGCRKGHYILVDRKER